MSSSQVAITFLLVFITFAQSHKPGEEYTYMSMFLKPQTPDMVEGDNHLGKIYEQLSVHHRLPPPSRPRHILHSVTHTEKEVSDKADQHNTEAGKPTPQRMQYPEDSSISVKVSEEMFDEDEQEDDDQQSLDQETFPREAVRVQVSTDSHSLDHADEDISKQMGKRYGENLSRLQDMLHKIILKYDIESLADVPCRAHAHWMPLFLEKVVKKKKNFQYYCVDTRIDVLKSVKQTIGKLGKSKFVLRRFWTEGIPRADLVLSWAGLDNMKTENVNKYFKRLSKTRRKHKLIAIGSHSGALKMKGSKNMIASFTSGGRPINVREAPFRLKRPMRIIGDLSTRGNDKQLYLYEADDMI